MTTRRENEAKMERYLPSTVAFIDILGFSHLVNEGATDDHAFRAIEEALGKIEAQKAHIPNSKAPKMKIMNFSDTIVMWAGTDSVDFWSVFLTAAGLTTKLLYKGILCRGAITIGGIHSKSLTSQEVKSDSIFGPAIIEAYRLEKSVAKFPRIVLSESAFKKAIETEKKNSKFGRGIKKIERHIDGIPFINPCFLVQAMLCSDDETQTQSGARLWEELRQNIEANAFKYLYVPGAWEKYQWVADRFNDMRLELPSEVKRPNAIDIFVMPIMKSSTPK